MAKLTVSHSETDVLSMLLMSWLTFWIPLRGEVNVAPSDRVAFSSLVLLTVMTVILITAEKRPAYKYDMWLDYFQVSAFLFALIPLIETVVLQRMMNLVDETRAFKEDSKSAEVQYLLDDVLLVTIDRIWRLLFPFAFTLTFAILIEGQSTDPQDAWQMFEDSLTSDTTLPKLDQRPVEAVPIALGKGSSVCSWYFKAYIYTITVFLGTLAAWFVTEGGRKQFFRFLVKVEQIRERLFGEPEEVKEFNRMMTIEFPDFANDEEEKPRVADDQMQNPIASAQNPIASADNGRRQIASAAEQPTPQRVGREFCFACEDALVPEREPDVDRPTPLQSKSSGSL
eukprot:gnl/TRDRNA2_/TRDRNA2_171835_c0_seq2.p1 gnl/TRDRNA2_/TRDRNA2_171835_c0~~gnl/TRDRNA2_/TRDRNA2_171835_c0_seq2.p1  ORF type:complete len:340 (+),score=41.62 gnl/TRDRNA2_/TRDRNA2_171835_c0_seq2:41-1060(+)